VTNDKRNQTTFIDTQRAINENATLISTKSSSELLRPCLRATATGTVAQPLDRVDQ
jgi:hypothetical protein